MMVLPLEWEKKGFFYCQAFLPYMVIFLQRSHVFLTVSGYECVCEVFAEQVLMMQKCMS